MFRAAGDRVGEDQALAFLARAQVLSGDVAGGVDLLREGIDRGPLPGMPPDEHRRLLASSLAGAAVQLGDVALASRALASAPGDRATPSDIGDVDVLVARGLSSLLAGQVERAHEVLLVATDPGDDVPPSPYARAALALAEACAGDHGAARATVAAVLDDARATYADRHLALVSGLVTALGTGSPIEEPLGAIRANLVGIDDAVTRTMAELVEAEALTAVGADGADGARRRAEVALADLGMTGSAWSGVVGRAVAAAPGR